MPKVSMIVPVYNVEDYLRECLDSLINQTLKDIEIICIDDKSTDNSLNILKEYASKDDRIIILEQEINQGQGVARNRALDIAKGEYIMFCDPDDWYELDACELAYNQISTNKNDMVLFSLNKYYEDKRELVPETKRFSAFESVIRNQKIDLKTLSFNFYTTMYSVTSIYSSEFLNENNIRFDTCRDFEDHLFVNKAYLYSKDISILDQEIYNYRIRNNSTSYARCGYDNELRIHRMIFDLIRKTTDSKSFLGAFLAFTTGNIFYWYGVYSVRNKNIIKDYYSKIREYFIYINQSINIAEYKQIIGKNKYKKFKRILKYNYFQYEFNSFSRELLKSIFSISAGRDGDVCLRIFGVKLRFKRYIFLNYRLLGNLLAWIFPTHKDRSNFIRLCRDIEDAKLADKLQKYYPKLAKKLCKKKKLRVLFLVSENSKWKTQSLYDLMKESKRFEPIVALTLLTSVDSGADTTRNEIEANYDFFTSKGMKVVRAYENHRYIDLKTLKPDIVFYQQPWSLSKLQSPENVSRFALTCYIPYFVANYGILRLDTGLRLHKFLFKHYVLNKNWAREYQTYTGLNNYVPVGHTILDNFNKDFSIKNNYVIYAPHYSVFHEANKNPVNYGTFLKNGEMILEYAKSHSEINWVFKPHPQLKCVLYRIWGEVKTEQYYKEWESFAKCCYDSDYIDLFLDSKVLITDCGSFLTEYFCTKKPIIHLISSHCTVEPVRPFKKIIDTFYKVHNMQELSMYLEDVIIKDNDYKKDERLAVLKSSKLLNNYAAKNIIEDLESAIWGTKSEK